MSKMMGNKWKKDKVNIENAIQSPNETNNKK